MNRKKLRRVALVLVGILLPVGAFGFGYFYSNKDGIKDISHTLTVDGNIIGIREANVEDIECDADGVVPGDSINVPIFIQPKSTVDSLLRVKIQPYWMDINGTENNLSIENLELINENVSSNIEVGKWYKDNGYYYYIGKLDNKTKKIQLLKGIKFLPLDKEGYDANDYQNMKIGIKVKMEMIQCIDNAYSLKWNANNDLSEELTTKLNSYGVNPKKLFDK